MGKHDTAKPHKPLPKWAPWLIGYACTLLLAVGLVYVWRVVFSLGALPALPLTAGVAGVFSLLYLGVWGLRRFLAGSLCAQGALCVLLCGVLYCFCTAPFQVPDESDYFFRSVTLSHGHFDANYERGYSRDERLLYHSFPAYLNHKVRYEGAELAPSGFVSYYEGLENGEEPPFINETFQFQALPFLPQAVAIALARALGFTALGQLYAARLINLALYTLISFFTFRNCKRYRGVFFAMALLPLSLFVAASASREGPVLALCFWMISYFIKPRVTRRDVVLFGLAAAWCTMIKPTNLVLVALLLLVPEQRWANRWNPRLTVLVMAVAAFGLYQLAGLVHSPAGALVTGYPPAEEWLRSGGGTQVNAGEQLAFVLRHLPRFVSVTVLTLYEHAGFLFELGLFGWMDLSIPLVGGLSVLSLAAASALGIQQAEDARHTTVWALALAALLYAAAILAGLYILESDVGAIRIAGVQARYFLPSFLMLFMVGSILLGKAVRPRIATQAAAHRTEAIALCIAGGVALVGAVLLCQNGFIGQWIPKSEGGYLLVNLLGRQMAG